MNGIVEREDDVKSVGIETDEDWEQPVRRVIPKLADLEAAAMEAGAELDAVISAANSNEYARDRLNRIYAFVYHAVQTDPEGFAVRTKVKVKAGVAYLIGFSLPRTQHRVATMIENAGFEIRDTMAWLFAQGFPKGDNLKPGHEAIILTRKPFKGSVKQNIKKWGVGVLNIDSCRITFAENEQGLSQKSSRFAFPACNGRADYHSLPKDDVWVNEKGRYPSNVLGEFSPEYQKFFFCPKPSVRERNYGCEGLSPKAYKTNKPHGGGANARKASEAAGNANHHPCLKPIELLRWLVRLVTPEGGLVLDPFMGSGTTGIAAGLEGRQFVGIEREAEYCEIAKARLAEWAKAPLTAKAVAA